jgi:hypothetical protein
LVFQAKSVALDEPQELAYLVWLGLSADGLEIDELRNIGMRENVVTPADATQLEAQSFSETAQVGEGYVGHISARETLEKLSLIHLEHGKPRLGR